MKTINLIIALFMISIVGWAQKPNAREIIEKVDKNMAAKSQIVTSKMIIHGQRSSRTIEAKTWTEGQERSFTEYLSPAREKGTKMLKLKDELWIYSPSTDRIIKISGHMLRQSVMGSDLSYEDMMDNSKLLEDYDAVVIGSENYMERDCWIVELQAKTVDVSYQMRKIWVDKDRYIPLKEELYAKSGTLLKRTELSNVSKVGNRWYPMKIVFKDMLKKGDGTEFIVDEIEFDKKIEEYIFTKAALK